jgi:chromosome segregation ATPase
MSEYQIDPLKLNEVLQQILDKLASMEERANAASPEFQILMNNYLTKANEAERNQARFEESFERQELAQQQGRKVQAENDELKERIRTYERDFDNLRTEHSKEVNNLREELSKVIQSKNEAELTASEKYSKEYNQYKSEAEKRMTQMQEELTDALQIKRKLEEKLHFKTQEADMASRELDELKVRLADEQSKIRNEIIEATQRSNQLEQKMLTEKEQLYKRVRELESSIEELNSSLALGKREIEYKDALLAQAIKQQGRVSDTFSSAYNVSKTTNLASDPQPQFSTVGTTNNYSSGYEPIPTGSNFISAESNSSDNKPKSSIGGIFSRLGS